MKYIVSLPALVNGRKAGSSRAAMTKNRLRAKTIMLSDAMSRVTALVTTIGLCRGELA